MRSPLFNVLLTLPLLACTAICAFADEPDTRLAQKVTIECANVRLHTAIEQIVAQTKMDIRTGINSVDWKVRDMPILVCAQNMALGNLLKAIADTNHLILSKSKDDNDILSYRLWRDRKYQAALDAYKETKTAAELAVAGYDWDVMSKFKDLPQADLEDKLTTPVDRLSATKERAVSQMIATLGQQAKERITDGEVITLTYNTAPESVKPCFKEVFKAFNAFWEAVETPGAAEDGREPKAVDDTLLNECLIRVSFNDILNPNDVSNPNVLGVEALCGGRMSRSDSQGFALAVANHDPSLLARPEVPKFQCESDKLAPRYVELKLREPGGPEWLDQKVKIEAPKDRNAPTYTDLLCGLSKAIGYSIVAEGPAARQIGAGEIIIEPQQMPTMFGREIAVREILKSAQGIGYVNWYVDQSNKLIIGRDRDWTTHLDALVPEKTILDLQKKLNGDGVELDDLEPLTKLTHAQRDEWIYHNSEAPELRFLPDSSLCSGMLSLYFSLSTAQKSLLKSGKAVALTGVDAAWMGKMLRRQAACQFQTNLMTFGPERRPDRIQEAYAKSMQVLSNNNALPKLTLCLEKRPCSDGKFQHVFYTATGDTGDTVLCVTAGVLPVQAPKSKEEKQQAK